MRRSAGLTNAGSLATLEKKTFRSNAVASTVFERARAATISRNESSSAFLI